MYKNMLEIKNSGPIYIQQRYILNLTDNNGTKQKLNIIT